MSQLHRIITRILLIFCTVIILFSSLSFYELYKEENAILSENAVLSTLRSGVAVVYAGPTFHDEVASSVSCILHDLGYYVVVYIGNGWHYGGYMVPFSGRRRRSSGDFYGRCVSQFVTITTPVKYVSNPDIMVFVTYPMHVHAGMHM